MIEQRTSGVDARSRRGSARSPASAATARRRSARSWWRRDDPRADRPDGAVACAGCRTPIRRWSRAYGGDPARHTSLGLVTCDQDDAMYVALDEATKHAPVDVIFAKSFYAGAAHASGRLSGEILGVIARAPIPRRSSTALDALIRCLAARRLLLRRRRQAHGHRVPARDRVARRVPRRARPASRPATPMAYLVAPPIEATIGARRRAQGRRRPRGAGHDAADRDELRVRVADRHARRVRGRGGRVRGGGGRRRGGAAPMIRRIAPRSSPCSPALNFLNYIDRMVVAAVLRARRGGPRAVELRGRARSRALSCSATS